MKNGIVSVQSYSSTQLTNQKSPLIWAPSAGVDLRDLSIGYIVDEHFDHSFWPSQLAFQDAGSTAVSGISYLATGQLSTVTIPSGSDHAILMVTGSTAALAGRVGIETRPLKSVTPGGPGYYTIFEAAVTVNNPAAVQGFFIGLTTSTGLLSTGDILATVSAAKNSNALLASTGAIGFWMHGDTVNNCDAVFQGQYSNGALSTFVAASTGGVQSTGCIVLANVLTANPLAPAGNPGNVYTQPASAVGVFTSTAVIKLGLLYNQPTNQVIYAVNGYQVAAFNVNNVAFDTVNDYGAIAVYGATNGATVSTGLIVDFFAAAAKIAL
jgi:hypothetical protein